MWIKSLKSFKGSLVLECLVGLRWHKTIRVWLRTLNIKLGRGSWSFEESYSTCKKGTKTWISAKNPFGSFTWGHDFFENGQICEELVEDKPYIRQHICDCPQPSFCRRVDCHEGYFVFIQPKSR